MPKSWFHRFKFSIICSFSFFLLSRSFAAVVTESLKKNGDIWLCSNPDHVVTRFFFVYDAQSPYALNGVNTQTDKIRAEIFHAMGAANVFKRH